jgi:hypothetical protein
MRKYLFIIALVLLVTTGCRKKVEMDLDMYNSDQISLMVKGRRSSPSTRAPASSASTARARNSAPAMTT